MDQLDRTIARRTAIVMLAMMGFQAWGLIAMLGHAPNWPERFLTFRAQALWGWLAGVAIAAGYVALSLRQLPLIRARFFDLTALKLMAIPFSLGAGLLEELFFRRMLMNGVAHAGGGWALQLVLSALSFGVLHACWGLFSRSWSGVLRPVLFTSLLGGAYAALYLLDGRDVAPCIWSHAAIDLCIEPWLLMAVMRLHASARRPSAPMLAMA